MSASPSALERFSTVFYIPHEVLKEIISYCDQPTLAALSAVSLACLELSSTFLYTDVVVRDVESLGLLFRLKWLETDLDDHGREFTRYRYAEYDLEDEFDDLPDPQLEARVSPHTSLSLIHSVTLHVKTRAVDLDRLAKKYLPPPAPVDIAVFVLSVAHSSVVAIDPRTSHLAHLRKLLNPKIFVARVRPRDGKPPFWSTESEARINFGVTAQDWPHWNRLTALFLDHFQVDGDEVLGDEFSLLYKRYWDEVDAGIEPTVVRIFFDYMDCKAKDYRGKPEPCNGASHRVQYFVATDARFVGWHQHNHQALKSVEVHALVSSKGMKELVEEQCEVGGGPEGDSLHGALGESIFVDVASRRLRRFRKELLKGARKEMDWAVLDET